jgi:hypothetical protein
MQQEGVIIANTGANLNWCFDNYGLAPMGLSKKECSTGLFFFDVSVFGRDGDAGASFVSSLLLEHIFLYNKTMSMDTLSREIKEAIALIDAAIRKIKMPPEELKRAKSKLAEVLKKRGS